MKAIFCKECKWNKNGWCNKYECNGKKRVEVCDKYKDDEDDAQVKANEGNSKYTVIDGITIKDIFKYEARFSASDEFDELW